MERTTRWYDQNPKLSKYINQLLAYPDDFLGSLSEGIAVFIEKEYKDKDYLRNLKSLGKEKIIALYKSKQRKRRYDQIPVVHKAMTYLYILPSEEQEYVVDQFATLFQYVEEYMNHCLNAGGEPTVEHVHQLTQTYVHASPEAAGMLLAKLNESLPDKPGEPLSEGVETFVADESEGMVIRLKHDSG